MVGVRPCLGHRQWKLLFYKSNFTPFYATMLIIHFTRALLLVVLFTLSVRWDSPAPFFRVLAHDLAVGRFPFTYLLTYILPLRYSLHAHHLPQSEIVIYVVTL